MPVMGDGLPPMLVEMLGSEIEVLAWDDGPQSDALKRAVAFITYGHPRVDGSDAASESRQQSRCGSRSHRL